MKHFSWSLLAIACLVFLTETTATAQTFIPHPPRPPHYIVLDTRGLKTVKEELTLIAMQGYRATYVAPRPGSPIWPAGMTIILEKQPDGTTSHEYELVEEKNGSAVHFLLDQVRRGYRYVRNSAFIHRGHDFWGDFWATAVFGEKHVRHEKYDTFTSYALLELSRDNAACRYRAQLTDPGREDRSPKYHFAEGFHLVGTIDRQLIFEKCTESEVWPEVATRENDEATAAQTYRLLSSRDYKKRQKELAEAVTEGFHVSHASENVLCLVKNETLDPSTGYQSLSANTESGLEKQLNAATGFRMVPETMIRRNSFWSGVEYQILMEKAGDEGIQYRYRILRDKNGNDMQDLLNGLFAKGFEVRAMNRDATGITVLMERSAAEQIPQVTRAEALKAN